MRDYEVETLVLGRQPTIATRFQSSPEHLGEHFLALLPKFIDYLETHGCEPAGAPFARYLDTSGEVFQMEIGLSLVRAMSTTAASGIGPAELPAGLVAATWHIGPYETLGGAHHALRTWVRDHARQEAGPIWEEYVTDPGGEPAPEAWRTRVVLPLTG